MAVARPGLLRAAALAECRAAFAWADVLRGRSRFNIGVECCNVHAARRPDAVAIEHVADNKTQRCTFGHLKQLSDRFALGLRHAAGVARGDRVGILLPQRVETAAAHLATYKLGAVTVALADLFGPEALRVRLADSGAKVLVTNRANLPKVREVRDRLPNLEQIVLVDGGGGAELDFDGLVEAAGGHGDFRPEVTGLDDPALIIYTSGTTGPPKGALHAHRVLLGHLPGVEFHHNFLPRPGDKLFTPADWAWIGGMLNVLLPSLYFGLPVVAHRERGFDPERFMHLVGAHGIKNVFMPPTALKLLRSHFQGPVEGVALRSIGSGGETLGSGLLEWGRRVFGVGINEFYGQTELNLVIGNNAAAFPCRPGSMGVAKPGHEVAVLDAEGRPLPPGEWGELGVRADHPARLLEYWGKPGAAEAKVTPTGYWRMGDVAKVDEDGYFWYFGRDDDVITSGGYRIGPSEVEACLERHPRLRSAAVVGVPDDTRTEIVKAFCVLHSPLEAAEAAPLVAELQGLVRERVGAHCYPREVEFVDDLPMTTTGKVIRAELRQRGRAAAAAAR